MSYSQAVARPVRTAVQLTLSAVVVEFVDAFLADLTDRQYAAAVALLAIIVGYVQVKIEDRAGKALLRVVPEVAPEAIVPQRGR